MEGGEPYNDKSTMLEGTLRELKKKGPWYKNIEDKLRLGVYRKNGTLRNTNRSLLEKTKEQLLKKSEDQISGINKAKLDKVGTLIDLIKNEEREVPNAPLAATPLAPPFSSTTLVSTIPPFAPSNTVDESPSNTNKDDHLIQVSRLEEKAGEDQPSETNRNCMELFDPCTREPIANIETLEKRVREIKKLKQENHPEKKEFPSEIKTRFDLLLSIMNQPTPPSSSIFQYTINGQLYEALWDIVFSLNLLDDFPRKPNFYMINKKAELIRPSDDTIFKANPIEYLKSRNVNEGASGASDISFCYKFQIDDVPKDNCSSSQSCSISTIDTKTSKTEYYFCSSKFYKNDSLKSVESFDIQKIYTAAKNLHQDFDVRIILLVKDKDAVNTKLKNARNKYISEEASKLYGEKELFSSLLKLYDLSKQKIKGEINEESLRKMLGISETIKPILSPRLHQHMAILKIQKAIELFKKNGGNNKFLVGILPRGGKTYIAGGIVSTIQPRRVVVLLGAKSETLSQFKDCLFMYYQDFHDYIIIDVLDDEKNYRIDPSKKYIFIMSVELYKTKNSTRTILQELKGGKNRADLFICDEAHLKQTTANSVREMEEGTALPKSGDEQDKEEKNILEDLEKDIPREVPVVYMTGTYIKPLKAFGIPDENVAIWDYQDIQEGKNIVDNENYFKQNFPGIYEEALEKCFSYGETYESIQEMYRRFPNLYLLSTHFTEDAKNAFLQQDDKVSEKTGFPTITHLFQVKKDFSPYTTPFSEWSNGFTNPKAMARLINYLSPSVSQINIEGENIGISSVMERIDRISQRIGNRLAFFTKDFIPHSQLWFLPTMHGHPLLKRISALAGILFKSPWYRKHFHILAVSSSVDWSKIPGAKDGRVRIGETSFSWACSKSKGDLKNCIIAEEQKARAEGKGLIILAQNMLHLGISLSCVDIVVLLDAGEKVDERIQKMYRALTESTNKKGGFIVDMNYFRTVTAIMNYQIQTIETRKKTRVYSDSGLKEAFNDILQTYSIDDDLPIYGTIEEGGEGKITSETLPELKKLLETKGSTDGITLSNVGAAMNRNIESILRYEYNSGLDDLLGRIKNEEKKRELRKAGKNIKVAEKEDYETAETELNNNEKKEKNHQSFNSIFPKQGASPEEKRRAFMEIFKTTLKLGVFGTKYKDLNEFLEGFRNDRELQEVVYNALIDRGAIKEGSDFSFIIHLIISELDLIADKNISSYKAMKESFNLKDSRSQNFQEILNYINDHLTPKDKERHKFGEVFTPLTLVDEMLSKLPADVWSKKDWKWLDPANGIGNFPIKAFVGQKEGDHIYPGLFEGLRDEIPDDEKRCRHIIENMLYMVDINGKNNMIARRLFEKLCPGAKANIEQIDKKNGFLTDKSLVFNGKEVKEFDVIMGNPPFQSGAVKSVGTNKTRKLREETGLTTDLNKNMWIEFVKTILETKKYLNVNGYLLFIHPLGWFKTHGPLQKIHDIIMRRQLLFINIFKDSQLAKEFGKSANISSAYYLLQNKPPNSKTTIIDTLDRTEYIKLNENMPIILSYNSILNKIIMKCKLFKDTDTYEQTSLNTTSCANSGKFINISGIDNKGNLLLVNSDEQHKYRKSNKVYIDGSSIPKVYLDKGEYGIIGQNQSYIVGDNLEKVMDYFKTKLSTFLLKNIKYRMNFIEPRYYPDVRELNIPITDSSLAKFFEFTEDEIKAINSMPDPLTVVEKRYISCQELKHQQGGNYNKTRKVRKHNS